MRKEIGEESSVEVFKGLMIIVNLENEPFMPVVASSNHHQNFKNPSHTHSVHSNSNLYVHSDDRVKTHTFITTSFVENLYRLEKRIGLSLTFRFNKGLLFISIPTELPDLSFYWQNLLCDFDTIMEGMQLMFDVLKLLQLDQGGESKRG